LLLTSVFVGIVVAGLLAAWAFGDSGDSDAAPDFTVELLDGGSFTLSEHLADDGRPLILNLWASWCGPCRAEMPDIDAYALAHPELAVLGVAVEDVLAKALEFAEEVQVSYPLGFDEGDFRELYPSIGLPATYFIDPDGTIAGVINGIVTEDSLDIGFD
jgi:thiol-disulfide isomerase/thioredoxin